MYLSAAGRSRRSGRRKIRRERWRGKPIWRRGQSGSPPRRCTSDASGPPGAAETGAEWARVMSPEATATVMPIGRGSRRRARRCSGASFWADLGWPHSPRAGLRARVPTLELVRQVRDAAHARGMKYRQIGRERPPWVEVSVQWRTGARTPSRCARGSTQRVRTLTCEASSMGRSKAAAPRCWLSLSGYRALTAWVQQGCRYFTCGA